MLFHTNNLEEDYMPVSG